MVFLNGLKKGRAAKFWPEEEGKGGKDLPFSPILKWLCLKTKELRRRKILKEFLNPVALSATLFFC